MLSTIGVEFKHHMCRHPHVR